MITPVDQKRLRLILLLVYAVSVTTSFLFCFIKLNALGYHTRDFPFYLQFGAKVFSPSLTNIYSINPYGYNALGFDGIEGMSSLFQTIHLEPIKFVYGVLYQLFGSPLPIFALFGLIYFAPPLYWGWQSVRRDRLDAIFAILLGIIFLLFPSSILAVADDLRPYTLLAPLLALAILSIHLDAPRWQTALFLVAMLSCREEAIILAVFVIGYAFLRSDTPLSLRQSGTVLGAIWLLWILITGLYYSWADYPINPLLNPIGDIVPEISYLLVLVIWAIIAVGYLTVVYLWSTRIDESRQRWISQTAWLQIGLFALVFIPIFRQVSVSKGRKFGRMPFDEALFSVFKDFMLFPKFTLIFVMAMVTLILAWTTLRRPAGRRFVCGVLILLTITCVYLQSVSWMKTPLVWLEQYQQRVDNSQLVWNLRAETNPHQDVILSDFNTYQAFADYEHIITFERLPWAIEPSEARHFPTNVDRTAALLQDEVQYIVIAKEEESLSAIFQLVERAQVDVHTTAENERYQVLKISR